MKKALFYTRGDGRFHFLTGLTTIDDKVYADTLQRVGHIQFITMLCLEDLDDWTIETYVHPYTNERFVHNTSGEFIYSNR